VFQRGPDRRLSDWQKLGPETKRILFPQEGQRQALGHFFLLAKKVAENPNPSGTTVTWFKGGELYALLTHPVAGVPTSLGSAALAKLLYSPAGVRALTRGMMLSLSPSRATPAAQTAAAANLLKAAKEAGVDVPALAAQHQSSP
jgi:hypothetical protein